MGLAGIINFKELSLSLYLSICLMAGIKFGLNWQFRIYDWGIREYWDRLAGIINSYELSLSLYLTMCLVAEINSAWIGNSDFTIGVLGNIGIG